MKRRSLLQLTGTLVFLGGISLLYQPLSWIAESRLEDFRQQTLQKLENRGGLEIEYRKVSPAFINQVEIQGLSARNVRTGTHFHAEDLVVQMSLWRFFASNRLSDAVTRVEVEKGKIRIKAQDMSPPSAGEASTAMKKSPLEETLQDLEGRLSTILDQLSQDFVFQGRHLDLAYDHPRGSLHAGDIYPQISVSGDTVSLKGRGSINLTLDESSFDKKQDTLKTHLQWIGDWRRNLDSGNLRLSIRDFESSWVSVEELNTYLVKDKDKISLYKVKDSLPMDFHVSYAEEEVQLSLQAEKFSPGSLGQVEEKLSDWDFLEDSRLDGRFEADFPLQNPEEWSGSTDLAFSFYYPDISSRVKGRISGDGSWKTVQFDDLYLQTGYGTVQYQGEWDLSPLRPRGTLRVSQLQGRGFPAVSGIFQLNHRDNCIYFDSASGRVGHQEWGRLQSELELTENLWSLKTSLQLKTAREKFAAEAAKAVKGTIDSLEAETFEDPRAPAFMDAHLQGDLQDGRSLLNDALSFRTGKLTIGRLRVSQIISMLPRDLRQRTGFLEGAAQWEVGTKIVFEQGRDSHAENPGWRTTVDTFSLTQRSRDDQRLEFSGYMNPQEFYMKKVQVQWRDYQAKGNLKGEWENLANYRVKTAFKVQDVSYHMEAVMEDGKFFTLQGDYGLQAEYVQNEGFATGRMQVDNLPLPFADGVTRESSGDPKDRAYLSCRASLEDSSVHGLDWAVRKLSLELPWGDLVLAGQGDHRSALMDTVEWSDSVSSLAGQGSIQVPENWIHGVREQSFQGWTVLEEKKNPGRYRLYTDWTSGRQDTQITVEDGNLEWLPGDLNLTGFLSTDVRAFGRLDDLSVEGEGQFRKAELNGVPVAWEGKFRGNPRQAILSGMTLGYGELSLTNMSVEAFRDNPRIEVQGDLSGKTADMPVSAGIRGVIEGDSDGGDLRLGEFLLESYTGQLLLEDFFFREGTGQDYRIDIMKYGGVIAFSETQNELISGYLADSGEVGLYLSAPFPLQADISGMINKGDIDLQAENVSMELPYLNRFIDPRTKQELKAISFHQGKVVGQMKVRGRLSDPDLFGNLRLYNVQLGSTFLRGRTQSFSSALVFKGKEAQLLPAVTSVDDASLRIGGRMNFSRGQLADSNISVSVQGDSPVPVRFVMDSLAAEGRVLGDVEIALNQDNLYNKIDLSLYDTTVILGNPEQKPPEKPDLPPGSEPVIISDIRLQIQQGVEILYPSRRLKVLRAAVEPGDVLKLDFHSLEDNFSIKGDLNIRHGEINYFNRVFRLREGAIGFNENQESFNPRLNLEAELKRKDSRGEDVTIVMNINSRLFDEFSPRFSSEPLLPRNELASLLGNSILPFDPETEFDRDTVILATSSALTRYGIIQPFEYQIREALGLDFVSIETQLVENIIENRLLSGDPRVTDESVQDDSGLDNTAVDNSAAAYLNNTNLSLGKYIGDGLFVEGGFEMGYNESILDSPEASFQEQMDFQTHFSIQMDTPLFGLEWGIKPSNWDNLFVNDQTLSFTWHITY